MALCPNLLLPDESNNFIRYNDFVQILVIENKLYKGPRKLWHSSLAYKLTLTKPPLYLIDRNKRELCFM